MLTCNLQGGLGNQLFQIFTTIALSLRTSQPFFFINKHQLTSDIAVANGTTMRYSYWDTFLSNLKPFIKDQSVSPKLDLYLKEQAFTYDPSILTNVLNNLQKVNMLVGYFQSSKNFLGLINVISELFQPNEDEISKSAKRAIEGIIEYSEDNA